MKFCLPPITAWKDEDLEWGIMHLATLGLRGIPELTWQREESRTTALRWFAHDMLVLWERRARK